MHEDRDELWFVAFVVKPRAAAIRNLSCIKAEITFMSLLM